MGGSSVCGWEQCVWVGAACLGGSSVFRWEQCVWVGAVCGWEQVERVSPLIFGGSLSELHH